MPSAQLRHDELRQWHDPQRGRGLAAVHDEALAVHRVDVLPDGHDRDEAHVGLADDREAVEVEVHPAHGADLAHP